MRTSLPLIQPHLRDRKNNHKQDTQFRLVGLILSKFDPSCPNMFISVLDATEFFGGLVILRNDNEELDWQRRNQERN
jgi:hypothetical protein